MKLGHKVLHSSVSINLLFTSDSGVISHQKCVFLCHNRLTAFKPLLLPDTHTAVHACGVGQHQPMDALIGADEDDDVVERLLDGDSPRQHGTVGELEFNAIVK